MTISNQTISENDINYEKNLSSIFNKFSSEPTEEHKEYLLSKGIEPTPFMGIKYGTYFHKGEEHPSTIVPYQNVEGNIICLQHILPDGDKVFHKGSTSSGTFFPITPIEEAEIVFLTEGYATAHSLQQVALKMEQEASVVSCGSVTNIPLVAKALKGKYRDINIIIAPDRPKNFTKNDPVNKAVQGCRELGINRVVFPMEMQKGDDWNDLLKEFSIAEILTDIEKQLDNPAHHGGQGQEDDQEVETLSLEPEPFPFESLPSNAVEYAKELAVKNMISDSIVGGSILSLCSLVVQGNARIKTSHNTTHPLSLFILSVAESGEGKTTIESFLKQPIEYKEKFDYLKYKEEKQLFYHSLKIWEKDTKNMTNEEFREYIKKNPRPKMPPDPKIIMSDATTEGILKQFNIGKYSLGLFTAEGVKVFGGYSMSKEKEMHTVGTLSCLWDGDPIERTRGDEKENLKLFDKSLTTNILIQNKPFEKVWGNDLFQTQGILARFLISRPIPKAGTRIRGLEALIFEYESVFSSRVRKLLNKNEDSDLLEITLSNDAHKLNIEYYNSIEVETGIGGKYQDIKAFASKTAEQARRIAGVITLFEDSNSTEIDANAMERGITLAKWYLDECLRISNDDLRDQDKSNQNKLLKILEKKGPLNVREIIQAYPVRNLRKKSCIETMIEILKEKNKISQNEQNKWGLVG